MSNPVITPFVLSPYQTNCFVVTADSGACWIVDCGFEPDEMLDFVQAKGFQPQAILLTHSHLDHIAGVDLALSRFGRLPLYIHEAEAGFCSNATMNLSALIGMPVTCTEPDHYLKDGDTLTLNGTKWRVVHTPGHCPGAVCFVNDESKLAIVGDTLFHDSIGRFDFPTSDPDKLRHTILKVMMSWPDDMTIYPGHGPKTTIGRERKQNPFVVQGF